MIVKRKMNKIYFLIILIFLVECVDPSLVNFSFIFHFHSDIDSVGLKKINVNVSTESGKQFSFDSTDFTVCPDTNDTCNDRSFPEVQGYTLRVPMTLYYELTAADGKTIVVIDIESEGNIICHGKFSFKLLSKYNYLIYLGNNFNADTGIIADFDKVCSAGYRELHYYSKPFINDNNYLYLVWLE